jgi:phage gp29-like protein
MKLADTAQKRIKQIPQFKEFLSNVMDALLPGMSVQELIWEVSNTTGEYIVKRHFPKNKDRFKFDTQGQLLLLQPGAPTTGLLVPSYKYVTHIFNLSDGSWHKPEDAGYLFYGKGLADTPLYHYFYFKVTALRFLLRSLERSGNPFKIYYTGPGNAEKASKLDKILTALQNDSVVGIQDRKAIQTLM